MKLEPMRTRVESTPYARACTGAIESTHGTGFNLDTPDHLRMVFLAGIDVLDDAIGRLSTFLESYQQ